MSASENKIEHPCGNESFFDQLGRGVQEMDWAGQEKARKLANYIQYFAAVSTFTL